MAKHRTTAPDVSDQILDSKGATLLDLLDRLLDQGVMATGDLMLGVAGVDLVYVRLSALICAADRVLPEPASRPRRRQSRTRGSR